MDQEFVVRIKESVGSFRQGPTVRDMYDVAETLQSEAGLTVAQVRIAGSLDSPIVPQRRAFLRYADLESYARNGAPEFVPLDQGGIDVLITTSKRDPSAGFEIGIEDIRRLSRDNRDGSYITFCPRPVQCTLSYRYERSSGAKVAAIVELGIPVVAGLVASYRLDALQMVLMNSEGVVPYAVAVGAGLAGLALDGARRFLASERRYLLLSVKPISDTDEDCARAKKIISLFKNKRAQRDSNPRPTG